MILLENNLQDVQQKTVRYMDRILIDGIQHN